MGTAATAGEVVVTVALAMVATVKVKAGTKEQIRRQLFQLLISEENGDWDWDRFAVKEVDVRMAALGQVPVAMAFTPPEILPAAIVDSKNLIA